MNTSCVAGLIGNEVIVEGVSPQCFQGAREWTRGHDRCASGTHGWNGTFTLMSERANVGRSECASAYRPVFPRKGNRCAA